MPSALHFSTGPLPALCGAGPSKSNLLNIVTVATANVNSLRYRVDVIAALVKTYNIDILCMQETKLSDAVPDCLLTVDGHDLFRRDRNNNGGGVAIYAKHMLNPRCIKLSTSLELVGVEICSGGNSLIVVSSYRPPSTSSNGFYESLADLILPIGSPQSHVCIAGDINIDASAPQGKHSY